MVAAVVELLITFTVMTPLTMLVVDVHEAAKTSGPPREPELVEKQVVFVGEPVEVMKFVAAYPDPPSNPSHTSPIGIIRIIRMIRSFFLSLPRAVLKESATKRRITSDDHVTLLPRDPIVPSTGFSPRISVSTFWTVYHKIANS